MPRTTLFPQLEDQIIVICKRKKGISGYVIAEKIQQFYLGEIRRPSIPTIRNLCSKMVSEGKLIQDDNGYKTPQNLKTFQLDELLEALQDHQVKGLREALTYCLMLLGDEPLENHSEETLVGCREKTLRLMKPILILHEALRFWEDNPVQFALLCRDDKRLAKMLQTTRDEHPDRDYHDDYIWKFIGKWNEK